MTSHEPGSREITNPALSELIKAVSSKQADACPRHVVDARGRLLERLELAQVLLVQPVEGGRGFDERGLSSREVALDLPPKIEEDA